MRVHLSEGPNLCQVYVLTVAQGNNFIKGKNQVEAVFGDLILLQSSTIFRDLVRGKHFKGVSVDNTAQAFSLYYPQTSQLR